MAERVLVCGDREWIDRVYLFSVLDEWYAERGVECVIEGECRGADRMARAWAECWRIPVLAFPADWDRYKKAAGPIRNAQMLQDGKPTLVLAFHMNIKKSKGTKDMLEKTRRAGIPWRLYPDP